MNQIELFIGIILGLGGIVATIAFLLGSYRKGKDEVSKASAESNDILRGLIEDQKQEMQGMRQRQHDLVGEMTALKLQVQILTDRRDYLETLVTSALSREFSQDPGLAKAVKQLVNKTKPIK